MKSEIYLTYTYSLLLVRSLLNHRLLSASEAAQHESSSDISSSDDEANNGIPAAGGVAPPPFASASKKKRKRSKKSIVYPFFTAPTVLGAPYRCRFHCSIPNHAVEVKGPATNLRSHLKKYHPSALSIAKTAQKDGKPIHPVIETLVAPPDANDPHSIRRFMNRAERLPQKSESDSLFMLWLLESGIPFHAMESYASDSASHQTARV